MSKIIKNKSFGIGELLPKIIFLEYISHLINIIRVYLLKLCLNSAENIFVAVHGDELVWRVSKGMAQISGSNHYLYMQRADAL